MSKRHTYRLELSAFDLDVLEDVLRNAIAERIRSPRRTPNARDEIRALREIRRAIFAQEPVRDAAALKPHAPRGFSGLGAIVPAERGQSGG